MKTVDKIRKHASGIGLRGQFNIVIAILVVIPILALGWYIFRSMDKNTIDAAENYMQNTMEREQTSVDNDIESLQMTTQYILEDSTLRGLLKKAVDGTKLGADELRATYNEDIRQVEQMLYSNPALYSLRVYSVSDNLTEMMPVLYRHSRMLRQKWAARPDPTGYCLDYKDRIFKDREVQDSDHLIGLITAMDDDTYGRLGYVESTIGISYMFSDIYEPENGEEAFLIGPDSDVVQRSRADAGMRKAALTASKKTEGVTTRLVDGGDKKYVVSSFYIREMDAHYVSVLDLSGRLARQNRQKMFLFVLLGAMIVVLDVIVDSIVNLLLKDFYRILETVYTVQDGDLSVRVPALRERDTAVLGNEINTMLDEIDALMKENLEKGLAEKNAQIRALENQINAHFIYNVLESINMMAEIDGEYTICDAVVALGDMMRYSLRWTKGMVTIADELDYVKNYVALMNIRLDNQVKLTTEISAELMKNEIPKMTLQPLVENAITHGFEGVDGSAEIFITAESRKDKTYVRVIDRGRGMTGEELAALLKKMDSEADPKQKHGYALRNIRERIRILCGDDCGMDIVSEKGQGTIVLVVLPHEEIREPETSLT